MPKPQLLAIRPTYRKIVAVGGEPTKHGDGWRWVRGNRSLVLRHAAGSPGKCTVELFYWQWLPGSETPHVSYSGYVENTRYDRLESTLATFAGGYWTLSLGPLWPSIRIVDGVVVMQQYPLTGRVAELARECMAHRCPPIIVLEAIKHDTVLLDG